MPYGEDITISVGDAVRIHPKYENHKFKKLKYGVTYFVKELHTDYMKKIRYLETEKGDTILLNMDQTYFEHAGKEEQMERNYQLEVGDVVLVVEGGYGFLGEDEGKYVEVTGFGDYFGDRGVTVKPYQCLLETEFDVGGCEAVAYESFGSNPLILLNTKEDVKGVEVVEDSYCLEHYNLYYTLTEKDIEAGKIKVDAYWVAKQWKTGSRDDSGALWHSLKTIARFGEKNDKAREIKALYNQAIALARIYDVEL
jgi:hypothetical protein